MRKTASSKVAVAVVISNKERTIVLFLCLFAALRVFLFSAAFPFFNNVDEQAHFDLVLKYGRGAWPHGFEKFSPETSPYLALYSTPEYFTSASYWGGNFPTPNWKLPDALRESATWAEANWWQGQVNHESGEPPLYYLVAGLWLRAGNLLGIKASCALYWIRFLNIFIASALVWIGFRTARFVFPDRPIIRIGLPALLAVWPQSAFYSIMSDVLPPLCFGCAFLGLVLFLQSERPSLRLAVCLGLALAATCLAKTSNLPLLALAAGVFVFKIVNLARAGLLRASWPALLTLLICAITPLTLWCAWNYHTFGDLFGNSAKIKMLGWTRKPIRDWWPHPIFTIRGIGEFWGALISSFWRGEFIWHGKRLASPLLDAFYSFSSFLILTAVAASLFWRSRTRLQTEALWLAILSFAALVAFLALLSVGFDFGDCPYPSREHPFFISGRLISAAVIPFYLLYVYAFDWVTQRLPELLRWTILILIWLFVAIGQTVVNWPAFASQYNFFHMCLAHA
jgi:hypothetical protein